MLTEDCSAAAGVAADFTNASSFGELGLPCCWQALSRRGVSLVVVTTFCGLLLSSLSIVFVVPEAGLGEIPIELPCTGSLDFGLIAWNLRIDSLVRSRLGPPTWYSCSPGWLLALSLKERGTLSDLLSYLARMQAYTPGSRLEGSRVPTRKYALKRGSGRSCGHEDSAVRPGLHPPHSRSSMRE